MITSQVSLTSLTFEMDGNPNSPGAKFINGLATDWESLCDPNNLIWARVYDASGFAVDPSIFIGGGSKDTQPLSNWKYTSGSTPDKDDIIEASAYITQENGLDLLYLSASRFDNNGDAVLGFWLFQNNVGLNADGTFSGSHKNGDLLIVADFGNSISAIEVYLWDTTQSTNLLQISNNNNNNGFECKINVVTPFTCGISNANAICNKPSCWTPQFVNKDSQSCYAPHEFVEFVVNLDIIYPNGIPCFSTFLSESRSSHSEASTLQDFAMGSLNTCDLNVRLECNIIASENKLDGSVFNLTIARLGIGAALYDVQYFYNNMYNLFTTCYLSSNPSNTFNSNQLPPNSICQQSISVNNVFDLGPITIVACVVDGCNVNNVNDPNRRVFTTNVAHCPTPIPTQNPTKNPTFNPTKTPTFNPTKTPTQNPTSNPTQVPSNAPSNVPTKLPTSNPTNNPSNSPTKTPTANPTNNPSNSPSKAPTFNPTKNPTSNPTQHPSNSPTNVPTKLPTQSPSRSPTDVPTSNPSKAPTYNPTNNPSNAPTNNPSDAPTYNPSKSPTYNPTNAPTYNPSDAPTYNPTNTPTYNPSKTPTYNPTNAPTYNPSDAPTNNPSKAPTYNPTNTPTNNPSNTPTNNPSKSPTYNPTNTPTKNPSKSPTFNPTNIPTYNPSKNPTNVPTNIPITQCETAYAFDKDNSLCFLDISGNTDPNKWGWTNGPYNTNQDSFPITIPIYEGAAHCDINNGQLVGYLTINMDSSYHLSLTFDTMNSWFIQEYHIYVGTKPILLDSKNKPILSPGQYPIKGSFTTGQSHVVVSIPGTWNNINFYIIGHLSVCK